VEQAEAVVDLVKNLPETLQSLSAIVGDPEFRAKVGDSVVADYQQRIDMLSRADNDGGWDGSITAGVEAGRLAVDIVSAGAAVVGAGKIVAVTAKAGVNLATGSLERMALSMQQMDAGVIKGFKSADEINALMKSYPDWSPAWKPGTQVAEITLKPGTRVQMVVDKAAYDALTDISGKADVTKAFGGWSTFDEVPNQAYARNQLAMTESMKKNVGYVIEAEITKPVNAHVGVVGAQGQNVGGGNQLHFIVPPKDRASVFKFVGGRALP